MSLDSKKRVFPISGAFSLLIASVVLLVPCHSSAEGTWKGIRISGSGASGWQPVVCENGNGWRTCEMPMNISLTASPPSIPANGSKTTISAAVTDYYGVSVGPGTTINWSTDLGMLGTPSSDTNTDGIATVTLTSVPVAAPATVTALIVSDGSQATIVIPFSDIWSPVSSLYTAWANYGAPYNCSQWTPSTSTVQAGSAFTQSSNCSQAQIAYRQEREQSLTTGAIRYVGQPVQLSQTVSMVLNQNAVGIKQNPPPPPPAANNPWSQCMFDLTGSMTTGYYVWSLAAGGYDASTVAWNSYMVLGVSTRSATSMKIDGVTYYRGAYRQTTDDSANYEVCR
jgi:hypothetical protein